MAPSPPNHSQHEPAKSTRISMKLHSRDRHVIRSDNHGSITICSSTQIINPDIVRPTISSSACYSRYVHDNAHKKWEKTPNGTYNITFNPLEPSGHYVYHGFNTKYSTFCPQCIFVLYVVWWWTVTEIQDFWYVTLCCRTNTSSSRHFTGP